MRVEGTENLIEKAYQQLKNMVFQQRIVPGQKLIYRELAKALNVSSTPVQLALCKLEQEGFVERIQNVGYYVKKIDLKEIEDLFDLRQVLEVHAIGLAIKNQTPGDLNRLRGLLLNHKNYQIQIYDRKKLLYDAEFHWQIAAMSGNREILKELKRIFEHVYLRSRVELLPPRRLGRTPTQHERILEMIEKRNIAGARKYLAMHITEAKNEKLLMLAQEREERSEKWYSDSGSPGVTARSAF